MMRALVLIILTAAAAQGYGAGPPAPAGGEPRVMRTQAGTPPLGRLFFTPAERAQLDVARRAKPTPQMPAEEAPPPPPPPQVVSYGGIVRRSDGKAMLWINNRLVNEKDALSGLNLKGRVRADGAVTLQVPDTGDRIEVKVGQSVEVQSGKVEETRKPRPEVPAATPDPVNPPAGLAGQASGGGPAPSPGAAPATQSVAAPTPGAPPAPPARPETDGRSNSK